MNRPCEEEKKDSTEEEATKVAEKREFSDSDSEDEDEELVDLPEEILEELGKDRSFESEKDLQKALNEIGYYDLRVVLVDKKPRQVMPGPQHDSFTGHFTNDFCVWARNKWGTCYGTSKIQLQNGASRDPDLSYWGYHKCTKVDSNTIEPIDHAGRPIPDVVVQFSWKNTWKYERGAINDMMNQGLESYGENRSRNCPRLGYLIKMRFSKKRRLDGGMKTQDVIGLDIYRLTHDTTVADALDPNNNAAEKWEYTPGGPDVLITIKPQDLGITGVWALLCGTYTIEASKLFQRMLRHHRKCQSLGYAL